ncbi:hypothetical protein KUV50_05315 [Membranicola marinus]|uniref:Cell division protein FtsQ n=1 Tax=Membranihabitans marinus TaxID=1227546 RepID=A0A953HM05_9BACT|nr:hypothetical protein [Membranihabitans marinus]MBY5957544.1 hypothetical protein [Membranihabitans marinus]
MTDRKKHINRLIGLAASVLVIAAVVGLYTSFGFLEKRNLSGVEFTVLDQSTENSLLDSVDVQYPLAELYSGGLQNIAVDSVSLADIEEKYRSNPFVKDCRTYIDKHSVLQIELVERIPQLRILSQNGGDYYIDRDGVAMPVSDHYTPRTMLATGAIPLLPLEENVDSSAVHKDLFRLAQAIESDPFMTSFVSEIHVNKKDEIHLYPLVGNFTIRLSKTNDLDKKFENLKIFLRDGLSRLGWNTYSELVIDYENQIIGKKIVNP